MRGIIRATLVGTAMLAASALGAAGADASRLAKPTERMQLLAAAAASPAGEAIRLTPRRGGNFTLSVDGRIEPGSALAVRSLIDRSWALIVVERKLRSDWRRTYLLERSGGRWRVRLHADIGEEAQALCRIRKPGTAVALDLGLRTPSFGRCRHRRDGKRLVRPMTKAELSSVRAMVEWRWVGAELVPGPVQPEVAEVHSSDCAWDGRGQAVEPPYGEVSRADPRWGAVVVTCVTGSDGFALLENPTLILVARAGRGGAFTRALAHTFMSFSLQGDVCSRRPHWPIPAAPRVALDFCMPFPRVLRGLS
jgi:hypothetical protein